MLSVVLAVCTVLALQALPKVPEGAEAVSLFGRPLARPVLSEEASKRLTDDLKKAEAEYMSDPTEDNAVWVGRRLAYLGRHRDAIQWFTDRLHENKESAKLLRHRGHRYITVREFDRAIADFESAARLIKGTKDEIEPDGVPNARNQPVSSLHSNVWYHLALARFLKGEYDLALAACDEGLKVSNNPDRLVSQTYWKYLCLRRLGRHGEARTALEAVHKDLDIVENQAYLRLLLAYKGELSTQEILGLASGDIENPTVLFGIGAYHLAEGEKEKAVELFERATSSGSWAAFGFIAAESELKRLKG